MDNQMEIAFLCAELKLRQSVQGASSCLIQLKKSHKKPK